MNEVFQAALNFSNYKQTLAVQRQELKEKIAAKLTYGINGGLFKIDQTLLNFVQGLCSMQRIENIVLLDSNENPILIEDLEKFREEIFDRYFTSTLEYYNEYKELSKKRSVEKLLDD